VLNTTWITTTNTKPYMYTGWPKKLAHLVLYALTSSNTCIDRFSNLFHCQNQENILNNIITNEPTTPQMCRYTTFWNVIVFKATNENKKTFTKTHFKSASSSSKADTLNIWCKNCRIRQLLQIITETINTLFPDVHFLKCVVTEVDLFSIVAVTHISQGSVLTHLRYGGIFSDSIIISVLLIQTVK